MTAPSYMTLAEFRTRTIMPSVDIDVIEAETAGFILTRLAAHTSKINTRLRKRCAVPFVAPVPEAILDWLTKIVTYECYLKRGVDPADPTLKLVSDDKLQADEELKEAANGNEGLFDLPLNDAADGSAITKGGPLVYTETSPYKAFDTQWRTGADEDRSGR